MLSQNQNPNPQTPNEKISGISYIGVLSVSSWPDTFEQSLLGVVVPIVALV